MINAAKLALMTEAEKIAVIDAAAERIAALKLAAAPETEASEDPEDAERVEYYECLRTQRLYLEGCKQRARNRLSAFTSPNPHDIETHVELQYINEAAMSFCNVSFPRAKPTSIDDCAQRMVDAETAVRKGGIERDGMQDYINELKDELQRVKGQRK